MLNWQLWIQRPYYNITLPLRLISAFARIFQLIYKIDVGLYCLLLCVTGL